MHKTALSDILRGIAATAPSGQNPAGTVAVAYSGGLDSRFVIHAALLAGIAVRALHVHGPHIPGHEHAYAVHWAKTRGVPLTVLELDPLAMPALRNNPKDRCYHCKKAIFTALAEAAGGLPLCDGTNASDLGEYRPGLKALKELAIRSPLAEGGILKKDIRAIGSATGLEHPDQAAQPCLLTRFGYGTELFPSLLHAVDAAEEATRVVFAAHNLPDAPFRVRYEDRATAALHLALPTLSPALKRDLAAALAAAGFPGAPIRIMPSLSGFFDRV